jgi:hypothetical protein
MSKRVARCGATGKLWYRDRIAAEFHLARIQRHADESNREKLPVRSYRCNKCTGWHLTSQGVPDDTLAVRSA